MLPDNSELEWYVQDDGMLEWYVRDDCMCGMVVCVKWYLWNGRNGIVEMEAGGLGMLSI